MDLKDIQSLIRMITKADLSEFKMKTKDVEISIRTDLYQKGSGETNLIAGPTYAAPPQVTVSAESDNIPDLSPSKQTDQDEGLIAIKSPIVGTFYRSSSPDKPAFIKVGDKVNSGDVVCIVEAMKLFNEIESEVSGTVVKVMLEDANPVEYDQVLFLIDPAG